MLDARSATESIVAHHAGQLPTANLQIRIVIVVPFLSARLENAIADAVYEVWVRAEAGNVSVGTA